MAALVANPEGLFALPNEILLQILDLFSTKALVSLATTCKVFHSVILRLLENRLQIAAGLNGRLLYLECGHPSEKQAFANDKLFCLPLGTDGLEKLLTEERGPDDYVGRMEQCGALFSRFRPQRPEPTLRFRRRVPGDIQGSRTHPSNDSTTVTKDGAEEGLVSTTVTVDANELFSQLVAVTFLGQRESLRGLLSSIEEVCEGTIRVWRRWLSDQCESRRWTDGEPIAIHHHRPNPSIASGNSAEPLHPLKDPSILWINTQKQDVGIKFKVKEKRWRQVNPVLFTSDEEVTVSYQVEFEEVVVRTSHLLLKLEAAQEQMANQLGKAVIFGSFRG